ncbi:serine/threonine-protein kinase [Paractinoplanes hotanensis]|uniref:non-specific serine/threonine protein kinase n=1 Tax=Paractinoplanes hotanensis TaxID=2906497 RepID=A0ABT0Y9C8_9ACTN|nr:serine/threonine-protein kinase [Actinoplanes hotanensis]MCM4082649.1 protein kinase [Actinoplanes hotanensis]
MPLIAGRYRLGETLGVGGMGKVWQARDEVLQREVAIKEVLLPADLQASDRNAVHRRTLREARAAARLGHPNVVQVFDVLDVDGRAWIVMAYVPSSSLQEVLRTAGPLDPRRAARVGLDLLAALRAAHAAGVDHRDVKPANVLLADDGRVLLTDFGIATIEGDSQISSSDMLIGSPEYMSPERARDGTAGMASDLWSLGATLYAAVEGHSPFHRASALASLTALAADEPDPPRQAGPLEPVLKGLLRKNPAERINAAEAEHLLRKAASGAYGHALVPAHPEAATTDDLPAVLSPRPATDDPAPPSENPAARRIPAQRPAPGADPASSAATPSGALATAPAAMRADAAPAGIPTDVPTSHDGAAPADAPASTGDGAASPDASAATRDGTAPPDASASTGDSVVSADDSAGTAAERDGIGRSGVPGSTGDPVVSADDSAGTAAERDGIGRSGVPGSTGDPVVSADDSAGTAAERDGVGRSGVPASTGDCAAPAGAAGSTGDGAGSADISAGTASTRDGTAPAGAPGSTRDGAASADHTAQSGIPSSTGDDAARASASESTRDAPPVAGVSGGIAATRDDAASPAAPSTPTHVTPATDAAPPGGRVGQRSPSEAGSAVPGLGPAYRGRATPVPLDSDARPDSSPTRRWFLAAAAAVVAMIAGVVVWNVTRSGPDGEANTRAGVPAVSAPGQPSSSPSTSDPAGAPAASASSRASATPSPTVADDSGAGSGSGLPELPAGWRDYQDRTGFAVYVPEGWTRSREGTMVYFRDSRTGRVLGIDQTRKPAPNPVADWRGKADYRVARGDFPSYREIHIREVDYFQKAADWEFTFTRNGTRQHVNNRGVITSKTQAYGFYWQTPDSSWARYRDDLQLVFDSFRPRS